jgi:hypothetical protein
LIITIDGRDEQLSVVTFSWPLTLTAAAMVMLMVMAMVDMAGRSDGVKCGRGRLYDGRRADRRTDGRKRLSGVSQVNTTFDFCFRPITFSRPSSEGEKPTNEKVE